MAIEVMSQSLRRGRSFFIHQQLMNLRTALLHHFILHCAAGSCDYPHQTVVSANREVVQIHSRSRDKEQNNNDQHRAGCYSSTEVAILRIGFRLIRHAGN